MRKKNAHTVAIMAIILSLFASAGNADTAEDSIKYRHAVMEAMSGHVAAFNLIATNKIDGQKYLQAHADAVANMSDELDILFPKGSGDGDTEALPAIWDDSEKFSTAIAKMQETAGALREATRSGDRKVVMGAFSAAGKACKGCHEKFRAEDENEDSDSHSH